MKTKKRLFGWLCLLMVAAIITSCSKGSDSDNEGGSGGGIQPDPDVPVLSEIKYELNPTATIVPETTTKQLTGVDTLGHKLTLPASATKPEVGQTLIFNTPTKQLPDGLLAKVKSVTETSSGYQVVYEDAQLKDAFKDIDIPEQYIPLGEYVQHAYDANGKEVKFQTRPRTRASGIKSYEIILPEIGWEIDKGIELTPKMSIDLLLRYVFQFGDYELSYCGVKIDADISVGADLNAELEASKLLERKFHILTIVCGAIPIGPVLLTPSIDVQGVVTIEGKITLEASISYERTLHASMIYQKGAGITGDSYLDPEADDALKFSFGPKFEGGIVYGLVMGGNIGVFGKTLAVRSRINVMKKETMSGKLNIAAFTGGLNDWLIPYKASSEYTVTDASKIFLDFAKKWDFEQFDDIMYNQAIGIKVGWDLTTIGVDVASTDLPEMNIPLSSVPIMPQVKIDEKDFLAFNDNDVTLTLHHTKRSVLDDLAEFRAEFKPVDSKTDAKPIVKHFDFDDDKRNWLMAEVKDKDVTSATKVTLNGEDDYNITVYMDILGVGIPIFEAKAVKKTDDIKIKKIQMLQLTTSFKDHVKGKEGDWYTDEAPVYIKYSDYSMNGEKADPDYKVQMTQGKDKLHIDITLASSDYYYHTNKTVSFDITGFKGDFSTSKVENLTYKMDHGYYLTYKYVDEWGIDQEYNDDYGRLKDLSDVTCSFKALPPIGTLLSPGVKYYGSDEKVNIGMFQYGGNDNDAFLKDYTHKETVTYKDKPDEVSTREFVSNPENEVKLYIEFLYE